MRGHFVSDGVPADLGGILIWAGIVSEFDTIPAQKPMWNDSRPVRGPSVGSRRGTGATPPFQELFDHRAAGHGVVREFLADQPSRTLVVHRGNHIDVI
jgi:hypothetical protein